MSEPQFPVEDMDGDSPEAKARLLDSDRYHFPSDMLDFEEFMDNEGVLGILQQVRFYFHDLNIVATDNSLPMPDNMYLHSRAGWLFQRIL